jgi:pSer/pThr/pTyr-binding forkhead associated (FHA) protein
MRCRRCGHENERTAKFCSSCGEELDEETTASIELLEGRRVLEQELGDVLEQLPEGMGMLVVRRGPNMGTRFVLEGTETTLGRHPDSDIFLDDVTVSRRHATIKHSGDTFEISDAGSLNGTYVDRERVETARLHDMSEVQIGRFVLTFVVGVPAEQSA